MVSLGEKENVSDDSSSNSVKDLPGGFNGERFLVFPGMVVEKEVN